MATKRVVNVAEACDPVSNIAGFSDDPSAVAAVIPIIEDILDAVSTAFLSRLVDPRTAAVVAPTTTQKEPYWPVIGPKSSKGHGKRQRSRSRSPANQNCDARDEASSSQVSESQSRADETLHPSPNPTVESAVTVHVFQDVLVTSQDPLKDLLFAISDDDTRSISDAFLVVSLGDLSGLE